MRDFLAGRSAGRPPFLPFATDFAARLEQVTRTEMLADPNVLTRALLGLQWLFGLDALVLLVEVDSAPVWAEAIHRLRILVGDRAALAVVLDGAGLGVANALGLEQVDVLGVLERALLDGDGAAELADRLTPLWNVARYYAVPSVFVAARAPAAAAEVGADAVVVWEGASAAELLAAGARRAGHSLLAGEAVPPLPPGAFVTTAGELPADTDVDWFRETATALAR